MEEEMEEASNEPLHIGMGKGAGEFPNLVL